MRNTIARFICFLLLLSGHSSLAQTNIWSASNFSFNNDNVALENMSAATAVTFASSGVRATDIISFPSAFRFQYGTQSYSEFSLSAYGMMKFGNKFRYNAYSLEDTVIVAFSNQSNLFSCSYKLVGTAPDRRLIIEWTGLYSGGNQTVKFQLWLYERGGRIEFVNQGLNAYAGTGYAIFCKNKIFGEKAFAGIDTQTPPAVPVINYTSIVTNVQAIPANSRYIFQPDTSKPRSPAISFRDLLPGCYTIDLVDSSTTERFLFLERTSGTNIETSKKYLSTTIGGQYSLYSQYETGMKPDSLYYYRGYVTNGFAFSDTTLVNLLTPMPMINGLKSIPGDYPSINTLLQDAVCKHIGPDLVIELQSNYSYAAEASEVRFKPSLINKHFTGITIRPAASATSLVITNSGAHPAFSIDSVTSVKFDGRAGGAGAVNHLRLVQEDGIYPAIAYMNNANHGSIRYMNVEGNYGNSFFALIFLGSTNPLVYNSAYSFAVSDMLIEHCKIGPPSGVVHRGIMIDGGENNTIRGNELFRFFKEAIYYKGGGHNNRIVSNRLYQPEHMPYIYNSTGANQLGIIAAESVNDNFFIDSNRIGGNTASWGAGSWQQTIGKQTGVIKVLNNAGFVHIRKNEIANVRFTGHNMALIETKGNSIIEGNKIGTADSLNSIYCTNGYMQAIFCSYGGDVLVQNNNISGLGSTSEGYLINGFRIDTLKIIGNDVGGSNMHNANGFVTSARGIEWGGTNWVEISNNNVRGISSSTLSVGGISGEWNYYTNFIQHGIIENNIVHHLDARRSVLGIFARFGSQYASRISGNAVYALHGRGISNATGADNPTKMTGIEVTTGTFAYDPSSVPCIINDNKVFALAYTTPSAYYIYPTKGIKAEGQSFAIYNNMINLGIDAKGNFTDSLEMQCIGIDVYSAKKAKIEHNSIYIGGKGKRDNRGIEFKSSNTPNVKDYYFTNNIIQIDRINTALGENKFYISGSGSPLQNVVANKNLWYSTDDPNINTKLQTWITECKCDSLSFVANPSYIKPVGDSSRVSLHLMNNSSADAAGMISYGSITADIDGDERNNLTPFDIGADAIDSCKPELEILSFTDTLYSIGSSDTVKYRVNTSHNMTVSVLYTIPVPGVTYTILGDSSIVFNNIPHSFRFRLVTESAGACFISDTTAERIIYVTNSPVPKTYSFLGSGDWSDPANWQNGDMPPSPLPFNGTILINPASGVCTVNIPFVLGIGSNLTVAPGKILLLNGNLTGY